MPPTPIHLPLPTRLHPARFLHRPNRFVVHARLEDTGEEAVAHLADPGRLTELLVPGRRLQLRPAPEGSARKTRWSAVLVQTPGGEGWVSVDTTLPNRLIARALEAGALEELSGWWLKRAEYALGGSRFDFLLGSDDGRKLVLEVKSVTLVEGGEALFPDAVTARGARHVEELAEVAAEREGWEAAVLFVLQRDDASRIRAAHEIDPAFADALARAREAGVRILGRRCRVSLEGVALGEAVPTS